MSARRRAPTGSRPPTAPSRPAAPTGSHAAHLATDRTFWLVAAGVFVLGIVAYANTLGHRFVWDDPIWLEQKIRFYRGPVDAFFEPTFMPMRQVYRPLSQLTYWLDQSIWWRNPFGFHLTSVVLHAANGVLVLWLATALGLALAPAAIAAALFLVHPIQPEAVAWITNRVDVLATFFVLATMLAALRRPSPTMLALVALASFGAAASKETGCVVAPLVLAAALTLRPPPTGPVQRPAWSAVAAAFLGILPYFVLRPSEAGTGIALDSLGAGALGTLAGSIGYQVERLLCPIGFWPYLATTPVDGRTLALAALGVGAASLGLAWRDATGRRRFAIAWILIAAALPVVVVLADFSATPVAEHRLYLATVGLALLLAAWLTERPALVANRALVATIGLAVAGLTVATIDRNRHWRDDLTLWSAVTARTQSEALPYLNLGLALAEAGRPADAEAAYRRALALEPTDVTRQRTSVNLGLILAERGDLAEAETLFTNANAVSPHAIAFRGLGIVARKQAQAAVRAGDVATASAALTRGRAALEHALAINPRYYQARYTLAGVLYDAGQYRAALAEYQKVVEIAGDTDAGPQAAAAAAQLSTWLAAHPDAP